MHPARFAIALLALVAGFSGAAATLHAGDVGYPIPAPTERMLYVRSGATASRIMAPIRSLAADVYWIRAIQHYGRDRKSTRATGRFELLYPLLDLTTTLDPHFNIAYRFGAVFLSTDPPTGPGQPEQAVALLEKGLKSNPDKWQYAHDAGFVYYFKASNEFEPEQVTKDYARAADWFTRAAAMPSAPEWIKPIAALTRAQGGDRLGASELLRRMADEVPEDYIRKAAERGLAQIQCLNEIDALQNKVEEFALKHKAYPKAWVDLVRSGELPKIPQDPAGAPYVLDPDNHLVSLNPQSPLGPLPRIPARR